MFGHRFESGRLHFTCENPQVGLLIGGWEIKIQVIDTLDLSQFELFKPS